MLRSMEKRRKSTDFSPLLLFLVENIQMFNDTLNTGFRVSKAVCGGCHTMVLGVPIPGEIFLS